VHRSVRARKAHYSLDTAEQQCVPKLDLPVTGDHSRVRVQDGVEPAEIAGPPCYGRQRGQEGMSRANPRTLVIRKEERPVLSTVTGKIYRTSDGRAELVLFERRRGPVGGSKKFLASSLLFRRNSNTLPWKSFVPDLIVTFMTAPPDRPNSARSWNWSAL
jgi:hypothetical protein